MIEWGTIAVAVIGSISISELINLFTIREQRKGMKIDNEQKEDERWQKLVDELSDQNKMMQEQNIMLNERLEKKDERIFELEDRCGDLRNKLDDISTNLAKANLLKCTRLGCSTRKPPLGYTELSPEEILEEKRAGNIE